MLSIIRHKLPTFQRPAAIIDQGKRSLLIGLAALGFTSLIPACDGKRDFYLPPRPRDSGDTAVLPPQPIGQGTLQQVYKYQTNANASVTFPSGIAAVAADYLHIINSPDRSHQSGYNGAVEIDFFGEYAYDFADMDSDASRYIVNGGAVLADGSEIVIANDLSGSSALEFVRDGIVIHKLLTENGDLISDVVVDKYSGLVFSTVSKYDSTRKEAVFGGIEIRTLENIIAGNNDVLEFIPLGENPTAIALTGSDATLKIVVLLSGNAEQNDGTQASIAVIDQNNSENPITNWPLPQGYMAQAGQKLAVSLDAKHAYIGTTYPDGKKDEDGNTITRPGIVFKMNLENGDIEGEVTLSKKGNHASLVIGEFNGRDILFLVDTQSQCVFAIDPLTMTEIGIYNSEHPIGPAITIGNGIVRIAIGKKDDKNVEDESKNEGGYVDLEFKEAA